tara:strand:- start:19607 stop:20194 length:588 start_codon:yes stop_codon:yes gene_type:complete
MTEKSNDEKLKILHERLKVIKEKKEEQENPISNEKTQNTQVLQKDEENSVKFVNKQENNKNKNGLIKYLIITILFIVIGYFSIGFIKNNDSPNSMNEDHSEIYDNEITYQKSEFNGNYIIVLNDFIELSEAEKEVIILKNDGYEAGVFQLSGVSNSKKEIFQTFIGPFNKLQEANQYLKSNVNNYLTGGNVIELK